MQLLFAKVFVLLECTVMMKETSGRGTMAFQAISVQATETLCHRCNTDKAICPNLDEQQHLQANRPSAQLPPQLFLGPAHFEGYPGGSFGSLMH